MVGVEYLQNGKKRTVGAAKEVILAAGSVGTAQILLLSGIGPKEHLQKLNVRSSSFVFHKRSVLNWTFFSSYMHLDFPKSMFLLRVFKAVTKGLNE